MCLAPPLHSELRALPPPLCVCALCSVLSLIRSFGAALFARVAGLVGEVQCGLNRGREALLPLPPTLAVSSHADTRRRLVSALPAATARSGRGAERRVEAQRQVQA